MTIRRVQVEHEVEATVLAAARHRVIAEDEITTINVTVHGLTSVESAHLRDELRDVVEQHAERARERPRTEGPS